MKTGRTDNWTAVHPNQNLEPLAANQPFASKDPARVSDIGTTLFKSGRGNRVQLVRPSSRQLRTSSASARQPSAQASEGENGDLFDIRKHQCG